MTNQIKQIKLNQFNPRDYGIDPDEFNPFDAYLGDDDRVYIRTHKQDNDDIIDSVAEGTAVANDIEWDYIIQATSRDVQSWVDADSDIPGDEEAAEFNELNK